METTNSKQDVDSTQVTPSNSPFYKNLTNQGGNWLPIIGIILLVVVVGVGGYFLVFGKIGSITQKETDIPTRSRSTSYNKTILLIHTSNSSNPLSRLTRTTTIYSFNTSSKQKKEISNFNSDTTVNEAEISPDGLKLYYHVTNLFGFTNKITTVDNNGIKKEHSLINSNLWTLSSPGILTGSGINDCYWSPDSINLACMLIERESPTGAGTGRAKIVVFNYNTGDIQDAFTSDLIAPPQRAVVSTRFGGWLGNDKLLIIHSKDSVASADIQPADFYVFNITSKQIESKFSYQYDPSFDLVISPNTNQIFFDSFSRIKEDKFIKYDITSKKDTVLTSSKDVLGVRNPVISDDASKLIYVLNSTSIHLHDLSTSEEEIVKSPFPIFYVDALLSGSKLYVLRKTPENSVLFDIETQITKDLEGAFIGLGYF